MKFGLSLLCVSLLTGPAAAQVRYVFEGATGQIGETFPQSFTLDVPEYIAADAVYEAADLSACSVVISTCTSVGFRMRDLNSPTLSVIDFRAENATTHYYFSSSAFQMPGTHRMVFSDSFNPAVLTVIGPPVPEPASALLTLCGLLGLAAVRKAKLARSVAAARL